MKKILTIIFLSILACQPDVVEVPFRIEYRIISLEIAMLTEEHENVGLLAGELEEMIKDITPVTEMENHAKGDAVRLLGMIKKGQYSFNDFEELGLLKEDLMILLNSSTFKDNHLDALWQYGNALLFATNTARDPVLDLYQWNEFEQQVETMKQFWNILERVPPSQALMRYDDFRVERQVKLFRDLNTATLEFFSAVEDGISTTYDLHDQADTLRENYISYLKLLADINFNRSSENSLE